MLEKNLLAVGVTKPGGSIQAHHIVAGSHPEAVEAQKLLRDHDIDINSPMNGVFLPGCGKTSAIGAIHCGGHSLSYLREVGLRIRRAGQSGAAEGARGRILQELASIKTDLLTGSLTINVRGVR